MGFAKEIDNFGVQPFLLVKFPALQVGARGKWLNDASIPKWLLEARLGSRYPPSLQRTPILAVQFSADGDWLGMHHLTRSLRYLGGLAS